MKIRAAVISHPGYCREKNEDNFCFRGEKLVGRETPRPLKFRGKTSSPVLMGVFDGMGGMHAGERASEIAADLACMAQQRVSRTTDLDTYLLDLCTQANERTCAEMQNVVKQRMGTTASMLCLQEDRYHVCNIGDSPIYLFRDNRLQAVFQEHTERENYLRIHGPDAKLPKKKFSLTQYIGIFPEEMRIEPYSCHGTVKREDRFLIASDGLTDMVREQEVAEILGRRMSPAKTVTCLLHRALECGGRDNITIICIDLT